MPYSLLLNAPVPAAGEIREEQLAQFRAAYAQDLDDAGVLTS